MRSYTELEVIKYGDDLLLFGHICYSCELLFFTGFKNIKYKRTKYCPLCNYKMQQRREILNNDIETTEDVIKTKQVISTVNLALKQDKKEQGNGYIRRCVQRNVRLIERTSKARPGGESIEGKNSKSYHRRSESTGTGFSDQEWHRACSKSRTKKG